MLRRLSLVLLLALVVAGCTDLAALDAGGEEPAFSDAEQTSVRAQVEKALAQKRYKTAWNQEVAAGAERGRLERIALAALEAQSRHAPDMFAALRAKHGALSAAARARVDGLVSAAREAGAWSRALDIALAATDDPVNFPRAWALYRAAPPERASALLESIREAKGAAASEKESGD